MFHSAEDVRWFKPVDLWTKYGRTGNISEPLALHGKFKGVFDSGLVNQDTVCMSLYKRVFPKWAEVIPGLRPLEEMEKTDEIEEMKKIEKMEEMEKIEQKEMKKMEKIEK